MQVNFLWICSLTVLLCLCSLHGQDALSELIPQMSGETENLLVKAEKALVIVDATISKLSEAFTKIDAGKLFAKLSGVLASLGPVFMAFSTILSVAQIFLPEQESQEMKTIRQGFEKVNSRMDGLQNAITEIMLLSEISNARATIQPAFDAIKYLEIELLIAEKHASKTAWDFYARRYRSEYKFAALNIYKAMVGDEEAADFRFDLLDLFKQKFRCNPQALTRVCLVSIQSINRGLSLEGAYLGAIKYPTRVRYMRKQWHRNLEKLQQRCGHFIMECESTWQENASKAYESFYRQNLNLDNVRLANGIYQILASSVPSKNWFVFASNGQSYDGMAFSTSAESGKRWKVNVNENGKNVIAWWSAETNKDLKKEREFIEGWLAAKEAEYKKCQNCRWDWQGPLYFSTTGLLLKEFLTVRPDVPIIVTTATLASGSGYAGTPSNVIFKQFAPCFCLPNGLAAYVFI